MSYGLAIREGSNLSFL